MLRYFNHFKKLDLALIFSVLLLAGIGLLSIYSSSLGKGDFLNFKKQLIFLGVGFFLMISLSFFNWRILRDNPYLILILYFFCLLALVGLLFFGSETRGVRGWYKLGPFSIDPIEATKIVLIILLAKYFSKRHVEIHWIGPIFFSGLYVLIPVVLIFFQPNLGSALILIILWIGILIISGIKIRYFLILCFLGILILVLGWGFLFKDYQKARIISFLKPEIEPQGIGWNQNQARIAIGSGGLLGQGIGKGSQTQYGFLPEPQTDFIFAALAEETGFLGILVFFFLFSILLWRIFKVTFSSKTNFSRLFSTGLAIFLISQTFIHIGMNLGILPIIGISLPLVSYGGSNLITILAALGILQSMRQT